MPKQEVSQKLKFVQLRDITQQAQALFALLHGQPAARQSKRVLLAKAALASLSVEDIHEEDVTKFMESLDSWDGFISERERLERKLMLAKAEALPSRKSTAFSI